MPSAAGSIEQRIGKQIEAQPDGCWLFNTADDSYGQATVAGSNLKVHRFVYETLVGAVPQGHILHHDCETKRCCNPAHLSVMTQSEHASHHARLRSAG